jgi:hypothetical protein
VRCHKDLEHGIHEYLAHVPSLILVRHRNPKLTFLWVVSHPIGTNDYLILLTTIDHKHARLDYLIKDSSHDEEPICSPDPGAALDYCLYAKGLPRGECSYAEDIHLCPSLLHCECDMSVLIVLHKLHPEGANHHVIQGLAKACSEFLLRVVSRVLVALLGHLVGLIDHEVDVGA